MKTVQFPQCLTWLFPRSQPQQHPLKNDMHAWLVLACPFTFCWYVPICSNHSLSVTCLLQMMVTKPTFLLTLRRFCFWILIIEALCVMTVTFHPILCTPSRVYTQLHSPWTHPDPTRSTPGPSHPLSSPLCALCSICNAYVSAHDAMLLPSDLCKHCWPIANTHNHFVTDRPVLPRPYWGGF